MIARPKAAAPAASTRGSVTAAIVARLRTSGRWEDGRVTLGVSLILIAVGAILVWGVNVNEENIDEDAIGVILMVIGLIGFLVSMIFWSQWSPV